MELLDFVEIWKADYQARVENHFLFSNRLKQNLDEGQQIKFALRFLHGRGKYYEVLWYLVNRFEDSRKKLIFLKNLHDEIGFDGVNFIQKSHEQLYYDFLDSVGIGQNLINQEILHETNYTESIKRFNFNLKQMVLCGNEDYCFPAFCAYEYLDNIDYPGLLKFVCDNFRARPSYVCLDTSFFKIHAKVNHFNKPMIEILSEIWDENKMKVINSFTFISQNQFLLWDGLIEDL